jgi:phospholipid/cholesterol/gamma-HCH transport system permease protein
MTAPVTSPRTRFEGPNPELLPALRLLARALYWVPWAWRPSARARSGTGRDIEALGVDALPLAAGSALLVGLLATFQVATRLQHFGAGTLTPTGIGWFVARELGPVIVALLVVARSSARIAGELAAMTVAAELDALRSMGLEPVKYLVAPRLAALLLTLPCLTLAANAFILLGAWLGHVVFLGASTSSFVEQVRAAFLPWDIVVGVLKGGLFALVIGAVTAVEGLSVERQGGAIGEVAGRAVSYSVLGVLGVDALLNAVLYLIPDLAR